MFTWLKSWKERRELKAIVRQMKPKLEKNYGIQPYYAPEQVLKTYESTKLKSEGQSYALAMYVQPELADRWLSKLGNSKLSNELRKWMIVRCFGFGPGTSGTEYNSGYNVFMDHHHFQHHISDSGGLFSSDESHGSHSHGGHGGGDFGGGHH